MQFTKLFNSILDSTIWQEPPPTKLVWITMLAMADRSGDVHTSIPGLARRAGVTLQECEQALECLLSPDAYSRTKDHDGRRIEEMDGGFALLNHGKYRALLSAEERREYNRRKQAEYRAVKKDVNDMSMTVNDNAQNAHSTEAEAEADTEERRVPPTPKGALRNRKRKANPDNQQISENTPTMIRINSWFGRRPETLWTVSEARTLEEINPTEAELEGMEDFYTGHEDPNDPLFRRTNVSTLLNNWRKTELDKARGYARRKRGAA